MSGSRTGRRLDAKTAKALAHPLRQRILLELERGVASPSGLAQALGTPLNLVAYHVGILRDAKCVEAVSRRRVRGAIEQFYRPTARAWLDDETFAELPASVRRRLVGHTLELIWTDTRAAAEAGGFDDPQVHASRTLLELDGEGYEALTALLTETLYRALEIHAESAGRCAASGNDQRHHRTELGILHFHRASERATRQAQA